jgi:hypothetical protein
MLQIRRMPEVGIQCFPDCFNGRLVRLKPCRLLNKSLPERSRRGGIPQPLAARDFPGGLGSSAAFAGCRLATAEHRAPPAESERVGRKKVKKGKRVKRVRKVLRRDGERHKILLGLCSPLR